MLLDEMVGRMVPGSMSLPMKMNTQRVRHIASCSYTSTAVHAMSLPLTGSLTADYHGVLHQITEPS